MALCALTLTDCFGKQIDFFMRRFCSNENHRSTNNKKYTLNHCTKRCLTTELFIYADGSHVVNSSLTA